MSRISDAAVEAAKKAFTGAGWDGNPMRAAIEAALPHICPQHAGDGMLPDALSPVPKEWYRLCERRSAVDRVYISGNLARAIVEAMGTAPQQAEQQGYDGTGRNRDWSGETRTQPVGEVVEYQVFHSGGGWSKCDKRRYDNGKAYEKFYGKGGKSLYRTLVAGDAPRQHWSMAK